MGHLTTVRWGILGTGGIARSFAEGLKALPDAKLLGVGSRTHETAASFAARFGVPHAYGSYRELAEAENIDVVYIATPNTRHKEDCLLCIDAGKAALCEKPFAMNAVDGQEIVDRARIAGVFFMEAMWMRFIPLIQKAREIVRRGDIGAPCLLLADFGYPIDRDPKNRFLDLNLGGGSLLDRGIYPLSLAWFLFGAPEEISGQAAIGPTGVDEQSVVLLKYKQGQQAVLTSSMNACTTNRATVIGVNGQIEIDAPFYRTERIVVTKFHTPTTRPAVADWATPSADSQLRRILRRVKRSAYRVAGRSIGQAVYSSPLAGNGFNYEAAEVAKCLREGALESTTMTGSESVAIIRAMDSLRRQWGIVYPNDP
jgi:predicted dehydrogenase